MFYFYTNELHFAPEFLGRSQLVGSLASRAPQMDENPAKQWSNWVCTKGFLVTWDHFFKMFLAYNFPGDPPVFFRFRKPNNMISGSQINPVNQPGLHVNSWTTTGRWFFHWKTKEFGKSNLATVEKFVRSFVGDRDVPSIFVDAKNMVAKFLTIFVAINCCSPEFKVGWLKKCSKPFIWNHLASLIAKPTKKTPGGTTGCRKCCWFPEV